MGKRQSRTERGSSRSPSPSGYQVEVSETARRELVALPADRRAQIIDAIDDLSKEPRPPGVKKLVGVKDGYRIRKGSHRVLYTIDDTARVVRVYRIGDRRDVYR